MIFIIENQIMTAEINMTCEEIAQIINGKVLGDQSRILNGVNRIEEALEGQLTFYANPKYEKYLKTTKATCLIVKDDFPDNFPLESFGDKMTFILVDKPYIEFIRILKHLYDARPIKRNKIHDSAVVGKNCRISETAYIGPNCTVGDNCFIGENVILHSNVSVYESVVIGEGSEIHANVTLCDHTVLGNNCLINPGAVIGSEGFGFLDNSDGSYEKIPQLGNVVLGDNVEIGSNSTIDRAMMGSTIIEKGVKMDNLVQIGHNAKIGENTAIVAQTGISGSTKVGKRNRYGGQVGVSGHVEIADDVTIYAQSGVAKSVTEKGIYFGSPIKDRLTAFKIEAVIPQLPTMLKDIQRIKKELSKEE